MLGALKTPIPSLCSRLTTSTVTASSSTLLPRLALRAPAALSASFSTSTPSTSDQKKLILLYSGGLDTSCILQWCLEEGYDVQAYMGDLGQDEDFEAAREKALAIGASKVHICDLREDFLKNYIYPAIQCNAMYENLYLLGTSLARPCISKKAVEIANEEGAHFVAHGATGKGNDQVRFELSFMALQPSIKTVAPWRDPAFFNRFKGRSDLIEYAKASGIPVVQTQGKPWSMDENMLHISYEAGVLEDPSTPAPADMYRMTTDPREAPDTPVTVTVSFESGIPTKIVDQSTGTVYTDGLEGFLALNQIAGAHGVGRVDVVENRFVGIKSRGIYETPAGEVLRQAHIGIEGLTLDREVFRLRDKLSAEFAQIAYNGFWFSPEMEFILSAVQKSQERVTGEADIELYKGKATIVGRRSEVSLYNQDLSSMDDHGGFNPRDSEGFININAIRLKAHTTREGRTV